MIIEENEGKKKTERHQLTVLGYKTGLNCVLCIECNERDEMPDQLRSLLKTNSQQQVELENHFFLSLRTTLNHDAPLW